MSQAILNQIVNQLEMLAKKRQLFREWDAISDEEAAVLKSEFATEDLAFAEIALSDYLPRLQQQDKI